MVQIIAGKKGKGKTKFLLEKANQAVKETNGTIVYIDKSTKHMYELNSEVRLINITEYPISSYDAFLGFISGIIAQDYDLQNIYLDSFIKIAGLEGQSVEKAISDLEKISDAHNITMVISISLDAEELPDNAKSHIVIAL
ncbi:MAG: twitching motility protein PilT [Lachnospiraceae bacterium]|nr:twitching motility protein PilT [Lachnospiraceae bacterium]